MVSNPEGPTVYKFNFDINRLTLIRLILYCLPFFYLLMN